MQDYLFSMGISVILETIKKPELKRKYRNVFLKVFKVIEARSRMMRNLK